MHNRQPITPRLLWQSLKDFDLWPLYILGLMFQIPFTPQTSYLTLTLKGLGWSTFDVNLLTIPYYVAHSKYSPSHEKQKWRKVIRVLGMMLTIDSPVITMLGLTYLGEIWSELTFTAMIGQIWALPILIALVASNLATINKWALYGLLVTLLAYPNGVYTTRVFLVIRAWSCMSANNACAAHPIQVAWNSRNANTVRTRTVSAACYNMFVQAGAIIGANIFRAGQSLLQLLA